MPLGAVILILLMVGVILFLINKYGVTVVDAKILNIINVVIVIAVVVWLLRVFGVWEYLNKVVV